MKTLAVIALTGLALSACTPAMEVVNYRTYTDPERGIFYIIDGNLDKGALISGVGNDQTRVLITREAAQ